MILIVSWQLRNRIALIQKEEERARKKIEQTKERAAEILSLRMESERRVQIFSNAAGQAQQIQQIQIAKNRELDMEGKKNRAKTIESLKHKKKEEVTEMLMEKKFLTQQMIRDQEEEIRLKQQKRDEIKRMEQEQKQRKEEERLERERRVREMYEQKLLEEAAEAKRAEKIVKALEKKEREWIEKLREAQMTQEMAFEQLESALIKEGGERDRLGPSGASSISSGGGKQGYREMDSSPTFRDARGGGGGGADWEGVEETELPPIRLTGSAGSGAGTGTGDKSSARKGSSSTSKPLAASSSGVKKKPSSGGRK